MDYYQRYRWRTVREAACGKWSFICRSIAPPRPVPRARWP